MATLIVTTTSAPVPRCTDIQNLGSAPVWFDNTGRVSTSTGVRLDPGGVMDRKRFANDLWVVAASGTVDLRYIV